MNGTQKSEPRKLTKAERERKATYEALEESLSEQGYRKHDLTIGVVQANLYAFVLALPLAIVLIAAFFMLHPAGGFSFRFSDLLIVLVSFFALIVVHEAVHGLVWGLFAKKRWRAVSFGFMVQYLTPYCTCSEPLPKYAYVIGALAPTVVLGLLPAVIGLAAGSGIWLAIGILLIFGGGGDMAIVLKLLRFKPQTNDVLYLDHPYECGIVAFTR
ncbi:DUF3267 domain-containing protein [Gordonibacter sp.]|uniref:DUF3267 domain-containing protein n=1 Tax=Gordonibacter sp. TaxID=1968902 RepID=UPI002FC8B3A4